MADIELEELKSRLEISEYKKLKLQKMLAKRTMEEEASPWGMVDIMTLLLVFFLFLYASSAGGTFAVARDSSENTPVIKIESPPSLKKPLEIKPLDAFEDMQVPPKSFTKDISTSDTTVQQLRSEVLKAISPNDKDVFSVRNEPHRLVLVIGERITFKPGEATLLKAYGPIFKKIAGFIASKEGYQVVVSGHTDNTPINTAAFPSNLELSAVRAINVANFLIDNGVQAGRMSIQGFSEYRPLFDNSSKENRQANRRVEISLINTQINEQNPNADRLHL